MERENRMVYEFAHVENWDRIDGESMDSQTDRSALRADGPPRTIQITTQQESHRQNKSLPNQSTTGLSPSQFTTSPNMSFLAPGLSSLETEKPFRTFIPKRVFTRSSQPAQASTRFAESKGKTTLSITLVSPRFHCFNLSARDCSTP